MTLLQRIANVFSPRKTKVFHIGKKRMDEKYLLKNGYKYTFFNTTTLLQERNYIGLWQRVQALLPKENPQLILLELETSEMMNEREMEWLLTFGVVFKITHG